METVQLIFYVIGSIGAGVFVVGYLWTQLRGGSKKAHNERDEVLNSTLELYKTQSQGYREEVASLRKQMEVLSNKISFLSGREQFAMEIMTNALNMYFEKHPKVVESISKITRKNK